MWTGYGNTRIKLLMAVLLVLAGTPSVLSQVSVNSDNTAPDPSAMLEIKAVDRGLLLPRLDYLDLPANPSPGLTVFITGHGPFGNGIYYSDGIRWMKIATLSYYMGQVIGGGIVFYLDSTRQHGLIAAPSDELNWYLWGCDSLLVGPRAQHRELMSGDLNTIAILDSCSQEDIGARICNNLVLNGLSDWYLPAIDELDTMLAHQDFLANVAQNAWYMSSTEYDSTNFMGKYNESTYLPYDFTIGKQYWFNLRCIRKF